MRKMPVSRLSAPDLSMVLPAPTLVQAKPPIAPLRELAGTRGVYPLFSASGPTASTFKGLFTAKVNSLQSNYENPIASRLFGCAQRSRLATQRNLNP
ncbi:MAG: hypothetical protein RLZZ214_934 [Verrucomicrobiota bacterium]|jgi:hypothetical protein